MRVLRHVPQLPQMSVSCSNPRDSGLFVGLVPYVGRSGVLEPLRNFLVTESPLPPDFDGGNHFALSPEAYCSR
jgi:hypothetical protein